MSFPPPGVAIDINGNVATTFAATIVTPVTTRVPAASGGATRILTAATTGSVNKFDAATGITYTLPTPAVGLYYDFIVTTLQTSGNNIITAVAAVFLTGAVIGFSGEVVTPSSTLGPFMFAGDGSSHVKFSTNGTATGGGIGSWYRFLCISSTLWFVTGVSKSPSATMTTPFST